MSKRRQPPKTAPQRRIPPTLWAIPLLAAACASGPALVDEDPATGFALYRSGRLGAAELAALCREGVREILVLDGTGRQRECRLREEVCPDLRLRYDQGQDAREPLSAPFLRAFDRWIEGARKRGAKIAFRCRHGWHRTGRLTAYYQIKHQDLPPSRARELMRQRGRFMWAFPGLDPQVEALGDFTAGRPCGEEARYCVAPEPDGSAPAAGFPEDLCPAP